MRWTPFAARFDGFIAAAGPFAKAAAPVATVTVAAEIFKNFRRENELMLPSTVRCLARVSRMTASMLAIPGAKVGQARNSDLSGIPVFYEEILI